tara:strand:- start:31 stop:303 length:273 start_codon:yes stop_codon:yes gene_type:complete
MANMRVFNLKSLNNVKITQIKPGTNIKRVFDLQTLTNWGSVTEANSNFPNDTFGAGNGGSFLEDKVDLGAITDTNVVSGNNGAFDFGQIA